MTISILIMLLIFLAAAGGAIGRLYGQVSARKAVLEKNLSILNTELETKERIISEVADLALGLTPQSDIDRLAQEVAAGEEALRAEQGRYTITQAELDAVESRLRELEEVERELEASALEASRELEMLQSQEEGLRERNEQLQEQLQQSFERLDQLIAELQDSQEAAEKLTGLKAELLNVQERVQWYTGEITVLNQKYMELKRAYDALDIEYAQLYEKQNALEAAREAAARRSS